MRLEHTLHRPRRANRSAGFTIVEVIMTFIIIGVLTLILVPVIANRSRDAKITSAKADMERLADAEERAGIDTGYYYRLYALNDTKGGDGANPNALDNRVLGITGTANLQGLLDNGITTNNYYDTPDRIFIYTSGSVAGFYSDSYVNLMTQVALNETGFNWNGPYVNWHVDTNDNDWPDDPWGHDYILFTRAGMIVPTLRDASGLAGRPDTTKDFQQTITIGAFTYTDLQNYFDRPTLVSFGPDGLPGDGSNPATQNPTSGDFPGRIGHSDDLIRSFGGN